MADTTVSIVVPSYKQPENLARAIDSIVAQTYEDWEIVVVNDAPDTDIDHVIPDDDRIRLIEHEVNQGVAGARNTGIDASRGDFVALLDHDDTWKPTKLERQIERFDDLSEEYGLVYTWREIVRDGTVVQRDQPTVEGWVFEDLLAGNFIASETPLIRRECFEAVGTFDTDLDSIDDLDMWLRIARKYAVAVVPESLAVSHRGHSERLSNDNEQKYRTLRQFVEKYRTDLRDHPEVLGARYNTLGVYAMNAGLAREAREEYRRSLRHRPRHLITIAYLLLTYLPRPFQRPLLALRRSIVQHGFPTGVKAWLAGS